MSRHYSRNLYQLGGFQGNLHMRNHNDYGMENTCRKVFEALSKPQASELKYSENDEPEQLQAGIELILGISSNGTSYVHLDDTQMRLVSEHTQRQLNPIGKFKNPFSFESLSPIYFETVQDLILKINTYSYKTNSNRKNKKQDHYDRSKANNEFSNSLIRSWRSEFELNRVMSKLLTCDISEEKFFVPRNVYSRLGKATVISIAVNVHETGQLIDIAWVEVPLKSAFKDIVGPEISKCHITIQEREKLGKPEFRRVISEHMPAVKKRLPDMLTDLKAFVESRTASDVFLLVHDMTTIAGALDKAGIDVSTLKDGLQLLMGPSLSRASASVYPDLGRYEMQNFDSRNRRRSRSRSPRRETGSPIKKRSGSPSQPRSMFVIDVDNMYKTVDTTKRKREGELTLREKAQVLGIDVDPKIVCTGEDCYVIIKSWASMASGLSIDEQKAQRGFPLTKTEEGAGAKIESSALEHQPEWDVKAVARGTESDDEYDPNDAPAVSV